MEALPLEVLAAVLVALALLVAADDDVSVDGLLVLALLPVEGDESVLVSGVDFFDDE